LRSRLPTTPAVSPGAAGLFSPREDWADSRFAGTRVGKAHALLGFRGSDRNRRLGHFLVALSHKEGLGATKTDCVPGDTLGARERLLARFREAGNRL